MPFILQSADVFLFHTPYCKLVQKSLARLMLNDFLSDTNPDFDGVYAGLEKFTYVSIYFFQNSVFLVAIFNLMNHFLLHAVCASMMTVD